MILDINYYPNLKQVLSRYSDILQDIDSITFIQKFYNINIAL